MARSEARIHFRIWDGLAEVPAIGKYVYMVILADETINHAGVGRLSVSLWAQNAGLSEDDIERGIATLEREPQVLVDRRTQEILVRTLIRSDRVAEQPYVLKAALKDALRTRSPKLRACLAAELRKLPPPPPDGVGKAGRMIKYPDPHAVAAELGRMAVGVAREGVETPSEGSPKGLDTLSDAFADPLDTLWTPSGEASETLHGGGDGGGDGSTPVATSDQRSNFFAAQQTIMPSDAADDSASSLPRKRGSRIPDDFAVDDAMVAWAQQHAPRVDGRRETEKFIDYWQAKSGKDATKLDWVATWRNWMRNTEERLQKSRPAPDESPLGTTGRKLVKLQNLKDPDGQVEHPFLRALAGGA